MTLVMLAIGTSVFRSRLHSTWPVDATAITAALACTPTGPVAAGRATLAAAEGGVTDRGRPAGRAPTPAQRGTRAHRRAPGALTKHRRCAHPTLYHRRT